MIYKIKDNVTYEQLETLGYIDANNDYAYKRVENNFIMVKPKHEILGYYETLDSVKKLEASDINISIKDLIDANYVEVIKHKCTRCNCIDSVLNDFYLINDKLFCEDCLLDELERLGDVEASTTTVYFLQGEHIGEYDEAIDTLISNGNIEKVQS